MSSLPLRPLVVDLDRSLLRCDLLHDALAGLAIRHPSRLVRLALTHRGNLAAFKSAVAAFVPLDPEHLPRNSEVLEFLRTEAARGRRIILATASPRTWAEPIAARLGVFSDVLASSDTVNLKAAQKLADIRSLLGDEPFDYIGDSTDDLPIFRAATTRHLVGSSPVVSATLRAESLTYADLDAAQSWATARSLWRLCRPLHWTKNLLIFLPALTSLGLYDFSNIWRSLLAFVAMCATASSVYIFNDLTDIAADRAHREKKHRPLAAATVSVPAALLLGALLACLGLGLAAFAGLPALVVLLVYLLANALYTVHLKEIPLADVCTLTFFYLLRILLGTSVLGVLPTGWFLSFLACGLTEIALWKRYVEVSRSTADKIDRRGYSHADSGVLLVFGIGFSFSAALILGLYTQSHEISPVYRTPALLTLLVPILLIHNLGLWLDGVRGFTSGDPIMRMLHSRKSWVAALAAALVIICARSITL